MIDAANAALYEAPESFDRVRVNVSGDIDLLAVIDPPMHIAHCWHMGNAVIGRQFISEHSARWHNVFFHNRQKRSAASIFCCERSNPSLPLCHANYEGLALFSAISAQSATATTLAPTAVVHFIDFYTFAFSAKPPFARFIEHGANLLKHAPCGLVGDASFALNLLCRNSASR